MWFRRGDAQGSKTKQFIDVCRGSETLSWVFPAFAKNNDRG
jgi:hypothetical protein